MHRSVDSEHEFDLFPAVKNGYIDSCIENDLFDLTYADLGQPKPNFVFSNFALPFSRAFKEGINEGFLVEDLELIDALADADKADGDFKLIGDAEGYAAFGGSIKFGQGENGDIGGF